MTFHTVDLRVKKVNCSWRGRLFRGWHPYTRLDRVTIQKTIMWML